MGWQLRDPVGLWLQSDITRSIYQLYSEGGQHKISLVVLHFPDKVSRPSVISKSSLIKCFIFILLPVILFFIYPIRNSPLSVYGHCLTFFCCVPQTGAPQQAAIRLLWSLLFFRLSKASSSRLSAQGRSSSPKAFWWLPTALGPVCQ